MRAFLWLALTLVSPLHAASNAVATDPAAFLQSAFETASATSVSGNAVVTYGVVINGDSAPHHTSNADRFAAHMKSHYGIDPANLIMVSTHKGIRSDQRGVEYAARTVAQKADGNDRIVVYTSGHGKWMGGSERYLVLLGGALYPASAFAREFLANKAPEMVYVGDQCYSGGFAQPLVNSSKRVTLVTATDATHQSQCWRFINPYLEAFDDPANDKDGNGRIDESEAFSSANDRYLNGPGASPTWGKPQFRTTTVSAPMAR